MNTIQKILLVATMFATALQAQVKISELDALTTPDSSDLLITVDVSDTTMAASGSTKKISLGTIETFLFSNLESATLTLENKTISGADNTLSDVPWSSLVSVPSPVSALAAGTWSGAASITSLGSITTGTWQGTPITDSYIASAATWNAKIGGTTGSTDNAVLRADGTGGATAQGSGAFIDDSGRIGGGTYAATASNRVILDLAAFSGRSFMSAVFNAGGRFDVQEVNYGANNSLMFQISPASGGFAYLEGSEVEEFHIATYNYSGTKIYFSPNRTIKARITEADLTLFASFISGTNYEGMSLGHDGSNAYIDTVAGSTGGDEEPLEIRPQVIVLPNLPTSSAGLPSGALWNDGGTLKIVP